MNIPTRLLTPAAVLFLSWLLTSCSILDPEDPEAIRIINRTESAIHVWAWELESSYTVDPAPSFTVDLSTHSVLLTGESLELLPEDIQGTYEPGLDVALFIFEVQGNTAFYRMVRQVTAEDLREKEGRVRISEF